MAKRYLSNYINDLRFIRRYTRGFDAKNGYDIRRAKQWSSSQKAQISKYARAIERLMSVSHYVYRPRSAKVLRELNKTRDVASLTKLKVAFIPVPASRDQSGAMVPVKPQVRLDKKGRVKIRAKSHGSTRDYLRFEDMGFDPLDFAVDPELVTNAIIDNTDYNYYNIMAGEFEIGKGVPDMMKPQKLIEKVLELVNKYDTENGYDPDNPSSSHYSNWLHGFIGYRFDSTRDAQSYRRSVLNYKKQKEQYYAEKKKIFREIEKNEALIRRLQRHKKVSPWISRVAQLAMSSDEKVANSSTKALLQKAKKEVQLKRGKAIPGWLRDYLMQEFQKRIDYQNSRMSALKTKQLEGRLRR